MGEPSWGSPGPWTLPGMAARATQVTALSQLRQRAFAIEVIWRSSLQEGHCIRGSLRGRGTGFGDPSWGRGVGLGRRGGQWRTARLADPPGHCSQCDSDDGAMVADEVQACPLAVLGVPGAWVRLVSIVSGI